MHNDSFDSHNNNPARLSPSSSSFGPGLLFNSDTAIGRSSSAASLAALAAAIIPVASASGGPAFPSLFEQHRDYLSSSNAFPSASAATSKPAVPAARAQYPLLDLHQPSLSSLSIPAMVRSSTTEEIGTFTTTDPASRRASNKAPTASVVSEIESFSDASGFARKGLVQKGMAHEMEMEMEKGSLDIADSEDEGEPLSLTNTKSAASFPSSIADSTAPVLAAVIPDEPVDSIGDKSMEGVVVLLAQDPAPLSAVDLANEGVAYAVARLEKKQDDEDDDFEGSSQSRSKSSKSKSKSKVQVKPKSEKQIAAAEKRLRAQEAKRAKEDEKRSKTLAKGAGGSRKTSTAEVVVIASNAKRSVQGSASTSIVLSQTSSDSISILNPAINNTAAHVLDSSLASLSKLKSATAATKSKLKQSARSKSIVNSSDDDDDQPTNSKRPSSISARIVNSSPEPDESGDKDAMHVDEDEEEEEVRVISNKSISKKRGRAVIEDDEEQEEYDATGSEGGASDEENDAQSKKSKGKGKGKATGKAKVAAVQKHSKGPTSISRQLMVMQAGAGEVETSFIASTKNSSAARFKDDGEDGKDDDNDDDDTEVKESEEADADDDDDAAVPVAITSKAIAANPKSKSTKPAPKLRGLAGVIQRIGLPGARPQGLSSRFKVPRLLSTLNSPPKKKPALPKEKVKPRKKGDEDYSDEERPWYEVKHPEDWDSDECEQYRKIAKRRESGYDS